MKTHLVVFPLLVTACAGQASEAPTGQELVGTKNDDCVVNASEDCVQEVTGNLGVRTCQDRAGGPAWGTCEEVACTGTERGCITSDGSAGVARCSDGKVASRCGKVGSCHPGEQRACGGVAAGSYFTCEATAGADPTWVWTGCNTPLVLSFDGASVDFTHPSGQFDLAGRGVSVDTDWVNARTPWLVLDRNGNGAVDDGSELFGSMTPLTNGGRASNGFVALAELDDDADGIISSGDAAFGHLLLWRDLDQNRISSPNELTLASDEGLESIALANRVQPRCTATACEMQRSRFVFRDGVNRREGEVIDVYFQDR